MKISDLNNLDFRQSGGWPLPMQVGAFALIAIAVLFAGYWFVLKDQQEILDRAAAKESELKQTFETKQRDAANLAAYQKQMEDIKTSFGALLRQLPSSTEVPEILVDISRLGIGNGLEFSLFKPQPETPKEFYAELPIQIKVTGDYHSFARFASDVAALPRIVTLHNLNVTVSKDAKKGGNALTMDAIAKTYRYLDEKEQKPSTPDTKGGKKKPAKKAAAKKK